MRRALFLALGLIAITWLEFEVFPGHTYLQGGTQDYVPMLERLDTPGYLSRDLVATHPRFTYTIYDEITLFLHEGVRLPFETALTAQQVACRAAGVLGVLLLGLAAGLDGISALLITAVVNLGAMLPGINMPMMNPEAVPGAFAFGLVLLSIGLLAHDMPLLSGFSGGMALVYDPAIAAPFWLTVLVVLAADKRMRRLLRPCVTILIVFTLLLANLAQLQPGITDTAPVWGKVSAVLATLQRWRTSEVWVSLWAGQEIWNYLTVAVCGVWATVRVWPVLNRQVRWLFLLTPVWGFLGVAVSIICLEHFRWAVIPRVEPAQCLLFTVAIASIACSMAGAQALRRQAFREALLWFLVVFVIPVNARVLDFLRLGSRRSFSELSISAGLAGALVILWRLAGRPSRRALVLLVPVAAMFILQVQPEEANVAQKRAALHIADWAERMTWGSSMFLFPDAGLAAYPGVFRAASRRAVWSDWKSGDEVRYSEQGAREWWDHWRDSMAAPFTATRLQGLLTLPIDYFVLRRADQLKEIQPVFANREFVVYDASDLRKAETPLRLATAR